MSTSSPAPVPNPAETVRRPTRILAAFMTAQQAQNYSGQTLDRAAFITRWQAYNGRVASLPPTSTSAQVRPLSAVGQAHVAPIQANPVFQGIYGTTAHFAMVELGRILAFQFTIDMDHSAGVHGVNLASAPGEDEVLNACLPQGIIPNPPAAWSLIQKTPDNPHPSVTVSSTDLSLDVAFGFPQVLPGGQVLAAVAPGANLMLVRQHGNHLVLANGYHRAYALRSRGVDFVPVVVVPVPRPEDLVPSGGILPQTVLGSRQPCIDDFLDDTLAMTAEARAMMKVVRMTFESLLNLPNHLTHAQPDGAPRSVPQARAVFGQPRTAHSSADATAALQTRGDGWRAREPWAWLPYPEW